MKGMVAFDCEVEISMPEAIFPISNIGVHVGTSPFEWMHGQSNVDFRRSTDDSEIPSQMCLIDPSQQTWIMARSYDEASRMVRRLAGAWGPLQIE